VIDRSKGSTPGPFAWLLVSLAASLVTLVVLAAGGAGLAYAGLYLLALVPGLPLGFCLFGSRHAAGWIVGAALGYLLTALALWVVIASATPSFPLFTLAWLAAGAMSWLVARTLEGPLVRLTRWTARDTSALVLVLLLVPAIAGPPFIKLGAADEAGNRYYRAYFTADFVWHRAVAAELAKFSMPPRNPFLASRPLHYYWSYFLLPASVAGSGPVALQDVETNLKVNAIATAILLVSAMFVFAWSAVPRPWPVAAAVALAIVASSAEGLYAIARLASRGAPLASLTDLNIDAIASWWFGGLRIDGIPRCFWWVPQHSMAYVLGLAALVVANAAGANATIAASALAGVALGGSMAFNPFVGGIFSVVWGLAVTADALRWPGALLRVLRCASAAVPVLLALSWCKTNRMFEGATSSLVFAWLGGRSAGFNLLLSLGPVLIPAAIGLIVRPDGQTKQNGQEARGHLSAIAATLLVVVSLVVLHFMRLRSDDSWVGFRAGQMIIVAVPALIACGLTASPPRLARTVASIALLIGLPTTIIDTYNAQDIANFRPAPFGLPWTQTFDPTHREALDWLRRATPRTAIVQQDPHAHDRTTWWVVPMFGERRMAAGLPPFLVDDPEYHDKSARVVTMFSTASAAEAWAIAHALGIDYVYVEDVERRAYPNGMSKFEDIKHFAPAFRNQVVTIYRVQ